MPSDGRELLRQGGEVNMDYVVHIEADIVVDASDSLDAEQRALERFISDEYKDAMSATPLDEYGHEEGK